MITKKLDNIIEVLEVSKPEFQSFDEMSTLGTVSKSGNTDNSEIKTQRLLLKQCQDRVNYLEKENLFLRNLVSK